MLLLISGISNKKTPDRSPAPDGFYASTLLLQLPREPSLGVITNDRSCENGVMIKLKVLVFLPAFMGKLRLLVITCPDFYREDTTAANRDSYVLLLLLQKHQQRQIAIAAFGLVDK